MLRGLVLLCSTLFAVHSMVRKQNRYIVISQFESNVVDAMKNFLRNEHGLKRPKSAVNMTNRGKHISAKHRIKQNFRIIGNDNDDNNNR